MKNRLKKEGSESVTKYNQLKLEEKTGKSVVTGEIFLPPQKPAKQIKSGKDTEAGDE